MERSCLCAKHCFKWFSADGFRDALEYRNLFSQMHKLDQDRFVTRLHMFAFAFCFCTLSDFSNHCQNNNSINFMALHNDINFCAQKQYWLDFFFYVTFNLAVIRSPSGPCTFAKHCGHDFSSKDLRYESSLHRYGTACLLRCFRYITWRWKDSTARRYSEVSFCRGTVLSSRSTVFRNSA